MQGKQRPTLLPKPNLEKETVVPQKPVLDRPRTQTSSVQNVNKNGYYVSRCGKQVKHEKVDYRKFTPILQEDDKLRFI